MTQIPEKQSFAELLRLRIRSWLGKPSAAELAVSQQILTELRAIRAELEFPRLVREARIARLLKQYPSPAE